MKLPKYTWDFAERKKHCHWFRKIPVSVKLNLIIYEKTLIHSSRKEDRMFAVGNFKADGWCKRDIVLFPF